MSTVKTYVLLDHTKPTANIYIQPNPNQRVRVDKRLNDAAFLKVTFRDRDGKQKTIRLKFGCNEIDQAVQIKDFSIGANEKFTTEERNAVKFKHGSLTTDDELVQKFLEASPQFEGFWKPDANGKKGSSPTIKRPLYKLYDQDTEIDSDNADFLRRLEAANRIKGLTLEQGQDLLLKLRGSFFKVPTKPAHVTNELVKFLDEASDEQLNEIIKTENSYDEQVSITIGRAINAGILSFETNFVTKKVKGNEVKLKEISQEYPQAERLRMFTEFLTTKEGKPLLNDLTNDLKELDKKSDKKAELAN